MKYCGKCNMPIKSGSLCQTCRKYQRNGGVWYAPSPYGDVSYDDNGKPICHICGMSCDKLIEHTKRKHGLESKEYRERFGLMQTARLVSPKYANKMRQYAKEIKTFETNFASSHSGKTRYINGRKPNSWSAQERASRINAQRLNGSRSKKNLSASDRIRLGKIWVKNFSKCK